MEQNFLGYRLQSVTIVQYKARLLVTVGYQVRLLVTPGYHEKLPSSVTGYHFLRKFVIFTDYRPFIRLPR